MKTLAEHNADVSAKCNLLRPREDRIQDAEASRSKETKTYPALNGILCPSCSTELQDDDSYVMLSYPGQKRVSCSGCGYKGTRLTL